MSTESISKVWSKVNPESDGKYFVYSESMQFCIAEYNKEKDQWTQQDFSVINDVGAWRNLSNEQCDSIPPVIFHPKTVGELKAFLGMYPDNLMVYGRAGNLEISITQPKILPYKVMFID